MQASKVAIKWIGACLLLALALGGTARAGSFEYGEDISGLYTLTLGYASAVRVEKPAAALIDGAVDSVTGLPTTINFDDGDRNFARGDLINQRLSALGEFRIEYGDYGLVLSGDGFYDDAYQHRNVNDSPDTINKSGDNREFTQDARRYNGRRGRLLDAYVYGDWLFGDTLDLNVRAGRQVVAWGESIFFSGLALAQGTADATKANVPGAELKSILLPVEQVALQLSLTDDLSLMGYYHLKFRPLDLDSVGAFFSTVDLVGPGAQFIYGFANPLYGSTPEAPRTINIRRERDLLPSDGGQWGVGAKYQLTGATSVGVYALNYHNTIPTVKLNLGTAELSPGVPLPQPVPVSYNVTYFDNIKMTAASVSTRLGPVNVAGEMSLRDGVDMLVNTSFGPAPTRGRLSQALLSAIYLLNNTFISEQIVLLGEAGYVRVNDVEPLEGSRELTNTRSAWAVSSMAILNYRNVLPKWDLALPLTFAVMPKGKPAMAGAFGALYGERDMRASVAANFAYLQNLQVGLSYNAFLGSPSLRDRPYTDRDYAAINAKYSF